MDNFKPSLRVHKRDVKVVIWAPRLFIIPNIFLITCTEIDDFNTNTLAYQISEKFPIHPIIKTPRLFGTQE